MAPKKLLKMDSGVVVDGVGVGVGDDANDENISAIGLDVVVVSYLSAVDGSAVDGRIVVLVVLEMNFLILPHVVDATAAAVVLAAVVVDVVVVLVDVTGIRYGAAVVVVSRLAAVVNVSIAARVVL